MSFRVRRNPPGDSRPLWRSESRASDLHLCIMFLVSDRCGQSCFRPLNVHPVVCSSQSSHCYLDCSLGPENRSIHQRKSFLIASERFKISCQSSPSPMQKCLKPAVKSESYYKFSLKMTLILTWFISSVNSCTAATFKSFSIQHDVHFKCYRRQNGGKLKDVATWWF